MINGDINANGRINALSSHRRHRKKEKIKIDDT